MARKKRHVTAIIKRRMLIEKVKDLEAEVCSLNQKLMIEKMNGIAIMECREYIEQKLGVTGVRIGGPKGVLSPFFDDLVRCLADRVALMQTPGIFDQIWISIPTGGATVSTNAALMPLASLVPTSVTQQNSIIAYAAQTGFPPTPEFEDGTIVYRPQSGRPMKLKLADGTVINIDANGSFCIVDKDAKITYKANRVREFNRYLNASDLLEEFVEFCGKHNVRQGEFMQMPIQLFIAWLIIRAAEADGEEPPIPPPAIPDLSKPRCQCCRRFIPRKLAMRRIEFCGREACYERLAA